MPDLLPCPFCLTGGKPRTLGWSETKWHKYKHWTVRCDQCGAELRVYDNERAAIVAWNKRYDEEQGERIADMKRKLAR